MSDYEHIVISAVRYALGRMTYIVELTVEYVEKQIKEGELTDKCLAVMLQDLRDCINFGDYCYKQYWDRLTRELEKEIGG